MAIGKKTGGRQKGSINKKTKEALDRAERVLGLIESKYLTNDIKQLSSSQRMTLYSDMLEYRLPKLSRAEVKTENTNFNYNVELSKDEVKEINSVLENEC
jgi:hypothetical protein